MAKTSASSTSPAETTNEETSTAETLTETPENPSAETSDKKEKDKGPDFKEGDLVKFMDQSFRECTGKVFAVKKENDDNPDPKTHGKVQFVDIAYLDDRLEKQMLRKFPKDVENLTTPNPAPKPSEATSPKIN